MSRQCVHSGKKVGSLLALLLFPVLATFAQHADQSESWRKHAPPPGPFRPLVLPGTREFRLSNGLTVVLVPSHRVPVVTVEAAMPFDLPARSDIASLTSQVTLAEATGELLTDGTGKLTSAELANEVESLGGRMESYATSDFLNLNAEAISENAQRVIEIVGKVLSAPSFPVAEVRLYKSNRLDRLKADRQDPAYLAAERFDRVVYGVSPYAITSPTARSVNALTRRSVQQFYKTKCSPDRSVVVIAGDFDVDRMEQLARRAFGGWGGAGSRQGRDVGAGAPLPASRRVLLVDRPGSEQADIRVGGIAVSRSSPDYLPLLVADAVLGNGTNSRLFMNVREKLGYAYDVSSSLIAMKHAGAFFAAAQSRTPVAVATIKQMLAELARLRDEPVPSEELTAAKNYLTGKFSLAVATQEGICDRLMLAKVFGLGPRYLEEYRSRIESVTAEQVRDVARRYIQPDRAIVVVVGDARKLRRDLASIGSIQAIDINGRRLP
jgi:zinc protease